VAYRLRENESVGKGLRRVVKKELKVAIDQLAGPASDERIHQARKSIKKLRSVVTLAGHEVGAGRARKKLRRAGHTLAPLRDAEAVIGSAQTLCADARGALPAKACVALARVLRWQKRRLEGAAKRDRVTRHAISALQDLQRAAPSWNWTDVGFSNLAAAIRRSYQKAQRGMRAARAGNRAGDFHEWRKRVKTLWYALRLIERRVPGLDKPLADLRQLEGWLGDDHNLVVLQTRMWAGQRQDDTLVPHRQVSGFAERRQQVLRRKALALGARVFKTTPKDFGQHLRDMWKSRRRSSRRSVA
jgi:CHAD domain-containing protein